MGRLIRQNKILFVGILCVVGVCLLWILYFPNTLVILEGGENRPSILSFVLIPIFFLAVFVSLDAELYHLGFQNKRVMRIIFSTLFALSAVNVAICRLFSSAICLLVGCEGMWRLSYL